MEDEFLVSYEAVTPGVPVLTRDKEQFGILEHVLEVPELTCPTGLWSGSAEAPSSTGRSSGNSLKATSPRPGASNAVSVSGGLALRRCPEDRCDHGLLTSGAS